MAIDFDAIKRKLERLSGNVRSTNVMWKPTEGEEHTVRLISFPDNAYRDFGRKIINNTINFIIINFTLNLSYKKINMFFIIWIFSMILFSFY